MARRRKKSRGTWLPNLGTAGSAANLDDDDLGLWFQFVLPAVVGGGAFATQTLVLPLTFDSIREDDADELDTNLADIIGSEYILRRIVGNLFFDRDTATDSTTGNTGGYSAVKISAGFFVARQADSSQNRDLPIGAQTADEIRENYSPSQNAVVREPWIWRRTWLLGRPEADGSNSSPGGFPSSNVYYNGGTSNQYVDAKTIRRVGQDDRLFFVAAARGVGNNFVDPFVNEKVTTVGATSVKGHLDYRLFGSLRRARQQGRF